MNSIEIHKARAMRLIALLRHHHISLSYSDALEAIAAMHGHTWAGLHGNPDQPVLFSQAMAQAALLHRLSQLHHHLPPAALPVDVMAFTPGINAQQALQHVLPTPWKTLPVPPFDQAFLEVGQPIQIEQTSGQWVNLGPDSLQAAQTQLVIAALGGLHEARGGLSDSFLIARGNDEELTIYANQDIPHVAQRLHQRGSLSGNVMLVRPASSYLGPYLRDVARHFLAAGAIVHTCEWSGSLTGAGSRPGPGFAGIHRTVSDDVVAAIHAIDSTPGTPTVVVIEGLWLATPAKTQQHVQAIDALVRRDVQVIIGTYARDVPTVSELPEGQLLKSASWATQDVSTM